MNGTGRHLVCHLSLLPRAWLQYDIFPHLLTVALAALGATSKGSLALFAENPEATVSEALQLFRAAVAEQARAAMHSRLKDEGLLELDNTLSRLASSGGTGNRRAYVSGSFVLKATGLFDSTPGDIDVYVEGTASDIVSCAPYAARKIYLALKKMGYEKDYMNSPSFGSRVVCIDGHFDYQHFLPHVVSVQKYYRAHSLSIDVILVAPGTS